MLRDRIEGYYRGGCEVLATRRTANGAAFWFVADVARQARPVRILGSIDRSGALLEQSAMDLLQPERLVFFYERLMFTAFALAAAPRRALLLGLGGGAMERHVRAYLPDCALTIVERDAVVLHLARRFFHFAQPVLKADAEEVVGEMASGFDIVLVDLYDAGGLVSLAPDFWQDCRTALGDGGCLAINWAGFLDRPRVTAEIARAARVLADSLYLVERGARPNMVQLVPAAPGLGPGDLARRLQDFARARRLPREDRALLQRCEVLRHPPDTLRA